MSLFSAALISFALLGDPEDQTPPPSYIRLMETDRGQSLHLQVAVRRFVKEEAPEIHLAGAMHIAQASFYESLQKRLDSLSLVLFESVKPPGTGRPEHDLEPPDDDARVRITKGRIRFMAIAIMQYKELTGSLPSKLETLGEHLPSDTAALIEVVLEDAWGNPLQLAAAPARAKREFDVQSLGADGAIGGEGYDADLTFSDQRNLSTAELGKPGGIQADLAGALGLVFQLDAMSHTKPNWRNSDLSIDQVEARLGRTGADADDLFGTLSGESVLAKAAGMALKLLSSFSYGNAVMKIMGVEILSRADDLLANAPGKLKELMHVLLISRNDAVFADLKAAIDDSKDLTSIGIIYGAAHMTDMEQRITGELGYTLEEETWTDAVTLDLGELDIEKKEAIFLRRTIQRTLDTQLSGW